MAKQVERTAGGRTRPLGREPVVLRAERQSAKYAAKEKARQKRERERRRRHKEEAQERHANQSPTTRQSGTRFLP